MPPPTVSKPTAMTLLGPLSEQKTNCLTKISTASIFQTSARGNLQATEGQKEMFEDSGSSIDTIITNTEPPFFPKADHQYYWKQRDDISCLWNELMLLIKDLLSIDTFQYNDSKEMLIL